MTLEIYKAIDAVVDYYSLDLPDEYKRRDPDEPFRAEKEQYEDKMMALIKRRFRTQLKQLKEYLGRQLPERKSIDIEWIMRNVDEPLKDKKTEKKILKLFLGMLADASELMAESFSIGLDWSQYHEDAANWAAKWTTEFLTDLNKTTHKRIKRELRHFVEREGYTLGDVISGLRSVGLDEARAQRIAVTEITRTFGKAEQKAGEALAEQHPDVRVVKTWFTNNDALVCELCSPLNGRSVLIDQEFEPGVMHPDRHVNCRCWMQTTTDITEDIELYNG